MRLSLRPTSSSQIARAFSMVEAVVSIVVVGGMLVAALNTVGANATAQYKMSEREQARFLAEALLTEILEMPYEDETDPNNIGRESGESSVTRADFDDVDDYKNWADNAEDKQGTVIPAVEGYTRDVKVKWVTLNDTSVISGSETGVKRVRVTVSRNGKEILTVTGFRTEAIPDPVVLTRTLQAL